MRPYTRSLDPVDYSFLPHAKEIRAFETEMTERDIPHYISHSHKVWENASIMQQLEELEIPKKAAIIDVGSGGLYFPPYLVVKGGYKNLTLTDHDPAVTPFIETQEKAYGIVLPFVLMNAENMSELPTGGWDVVMCISAIEHMGNHDAALRELWRLCKPGGYIFITSDYFRCDSYGRLDTTQYLTSPYRHCQVTPYTEAFVKDLPSKIAADFVGETDLEYRGDFVHNYSFVNICLQKAA